MDGSPTDVWELDGIPMASDIRWNSNDVMLAHQVQQLALRIGRRQGAMCICIMCICYVCLYLLHCALYQSSVSSPSSFVSSASVSTTVGNQNTIPPDLVSAFFDRSTTGLLAAAKDLASFRLNNLRRQVVDDFKAVLLSISSPAIESVWGALWILKPSHRWTHSLLLIPLEPEH